MPDVSRGRSLIQFLILGLYSSLAGPSLRRSRIGSWLFAQVYIGYKLLIEAGPIHRLMDRIRPGTWAIDVGANIGVFTILFARGVRDPGGVIAVEPEPQNLSILRRRLDNAGLASRVFVHAGVAAEQDGIQHLQLSPNHPGDHRLATSGLAVAGTTLDSLAEACGATIVSLIKIDVQGAELRVLQGAAAVLARDKPDLFIEIDDAALRQQQTTAAELVDWLAHHGYAPYRLRRHGEPLTLTRDEILSTPGYIDVLFLADQ